MALVVRKAHAPNVPPICAAIRAERLGARLTQNALAERLGVQQGQVAKWETKREPSLDQIAAMDKALGLARGQLLRVAGYVEDGTTPEQLIASDRRLSPEGRRLALRMYQGALGES